MPSRAELKATPSAPENKTRQDISCRDGRCFLAGELAGHDGCCLLVEIGRAVDEVTVANAALSPLLSAETDARTVTLCSLPPGVPNSHDDLVALERGGRCLWFQRRRMFERLPDIPTSCTLIAMIVTLPTSKGTESEEALEHANSSSVVLYV